jgi:V8-like Glu-specific endopeptidase
MYMHLGEPTHTPAPPRGVVITPPPPAPVPPAPVPANAAPIRLPAVPLTRVQDTRVEPFNSICRIVTTVHGKPGESIGTGILISPYHVLTCAHVISPFAPPNNTKEIIVFPGQNGPDSGCHARADAWAINPAWWANNCYTAGQDLGIIRMACPMNPGFVPLRPFNVSQLVGATASLAGYPSTREPKARHMHFSRGSIAGDIRIQRCTATTADAPPPSNISEATNLIAHDLDTAPSMSGSPMWIVQAGGRFLVALHSGRIGNNTRGKAVLLNAAVRRLVADWIRRFPPLPR